MLTLSLFLLYGTNVSLPFVGLKPFVDLGFKNIQGIEPAKNLADLANKNGINTFHGYLSDKAINPIKNGFWWTSLRN